MEDYDSTQDTMDHVMKVRWNLGLVVNNLLRRATEHDESKLHEPEKSVFDIATPKLANLEYGSPEYKESLAELGPALDHHYAVNSHHPEHFQHGINSMSLLDIIEMLCDWHAASERTKGGPTRTFGDSLEFNKIRFDISDQLYDVIFNTAKELGF